MQIMLATMAFGSTDIENVLCLSTDPTKISEYIHTTFGETPFVEQEVRDGILIKVKNKKCWVYIRYIWCPDTDHIPDTAYIVYGVNRNKDNPIKTKYWIEHILFSTEKCDDIIKMKRILDSEYDYRIKNKCGITNIKGRRVGWRFHDYECDYVIQERKIL